MRLATGGARWVSAQHRTIRRMRKSLVAAVVVVLVAMGATVSVQSREATAASRAGTPLGDGFVVAQGTRLLGAVIPSTPKIPFGSDSQGWKAYLWVDTDAASVLNVYAKQSKQSGFEEDAQHPASCSRTLAPAGLRARGLAFNPPEPPAMTQAVKCTADYSGDDLRFSITVWVCRSCATPTGEARLAVTHGPYGPPTEQGPITLLPPGSPTAKLNARERAQALRAIPTDGEAFRNDVSTELPRVVSGSMALAPALAFDDCVTGDLTAVLRLQSNTRPILDSLLNQSDEPASFKPNPDEVVDGVAVTGYRYAYYTGLQVVEHPQQRRPTTIVEWCND